MLYPHDAVNGTPNEIINCRCHVEYFLKNYGTYNKTETNTSKLGSISGLGAGSDPKPLGNDLPKDKIVNPNYNPSDDQWNQNCPSAVIAYEMKIRGETNAEALSAKEYPIIEGKINVFGNAHEVKLDENIDFRTYFAKSKTQSICVVHNHPSCTGFSSEDLALFLKPQIKTMVAVTNKGKVYLLHKKENFDRTKVSDIINSNKELKTDEITKKILEKASRCGIEYLR